MHWSNPIGLSKGVFQKKKTGGFALINGNNPVTTISAFVGHSTPTETLDTYSHMFEESLEGVTNYFDKIYEENNKKTYSINNYNINVYITNFNLYI